MTESRFYGIPFYLNHDFGDYKINGIKIKLMRYFFTICCLIVFSSIYSQQISADSIAKFLEGRVGCGMVPPVTKPVIIIRCASTIMNNEPLVIIDGVPVESTVLSKLDPNEVESIDVLKEATASALYGSRAARGVIIITTKTANLRKFIIKDFLNGERIAVATVTFISNDNKDTLMFVANDSAFVTTDKLKWDKEYKIIVSSAGYTTLKTSVGKSKSQDLFLQRDIKQNNEVVVIGFSEARRRVSCICYTSRTYGYGDYESSVNEKSYSLYPNPAQRGKAVRVSTQLKTDSEVSIKIFSLSGQLILSEKKKALNGNSQMTINLESRWTPGTYFVQISNPQGKLLNNEKLIIQ